MKHLALIFSSVLIIIAFFVGVLYEKVSVKVMNDHSENRKYYVNLEVLKTKLKINNDNQNVIVTINGEVLGEKKTIELIK